MADDQPNGTATPPPMPPPYLLGQGYSVEETQIMVQSGLPLLDHLVVQCPAVGPIRPARGPQGQLIMAHHPQTGEVQGLIFMMPIVLPIQPPSLSQGILGVNGAFAERNEIAGPVGAMARVVIPRASCAPDALRAHDLLTSAIFTTPGEG